MKAIASSLLFLFFFQFMMAQGDTAPVTPRQKADLIPSGAYDIKFDSLSGKFSCFLPENMEVAGLFIRGGRHREWMTSFWTNGNLATCWLVKDQEIQGFPVMAATTWIEFFRWLPGTNSAKIEFYPNGKLKRFKLAKDMVIQGTRFNRGDVILLDSAGLLMK